MSLFSVDVEADGPAPGLFSMVSIGIVRIDRDLKTTYTTKVKPISDEWIPDALAVSGHTREETLAFPEAKIVIPEMVQWIKDNNGKGRAIFVSDNPGFDFSFFNWYCWAFCNENPMGFSSRRIGDIYSGAMLDLQASARDWHKFRKTKHTHDPLDDAMANAEALINMCDTLKIKCKQIQ